MEEIIGPMNYVDFEKAWENHKKILEFTHRVIEKKIFYEGWQAHSQDKAKALEWVCSWVAGQRDRTESVGGLNGQKYTYKHVIGYIIEEIEKITGMNYDDWLQSIAPAQAKGEA